MKDDTQLYRHVATIWSLALTVIFGAEVYFLLALLTGNTILAGITAAVVTVGLGGLTWFVSQRNRATQERRRWQVRRDRQLPPYFLLGDQADDSLRALLRERGTHIGGASGCPWAEEMEAQDKRFPFRRGGDLGGRFRF